MNEFDEYYDLLYPKFSEVEIRDVLMKTLGTTNYDFMVDIIMDKLNEVYIQYNLPNTHGEIDN